MNLYEIIKQLQNTSSTNDKIALLKLHKDNELLKEYLHAAYNPRINFYVTAKTLPKRSVQTDSLPFIKDYIHYAIDCLSNRKITGDNAKGFIQCNMNTMSDEAVELYTYMLLKDIRAGISDTTINKVWPDLIPTTPYQRCSLLDDKAKKHFSSLKEMVIQTKLDGSFVYLSIPREGAVEAITRNGSTYPTWFAEMLAEGISEASRGIVIVGELLVYNNQTDETYPRTIGNGKLNSILQGGEREASDYFDVIAWDVLTQEEFSEAKSNQPYFVRLERLHNLSAWRVVPVETVWVKSLDEAFKFNQRMLAQGLEGSVLKDPSETWKNGTSKKMVKLKIEAEIDLKIIGFTEGSGKASGMLGALQCESSCGKVKVDVGSGFTDKQRQEIWNNKEQHIGKVVVIKANDILTKDGSDVYSLFLPIHLEIRTDKTEADSFEKIVEIFNSIKGL